MEVNNYLDWDEFINLMEYGERKPIENLYDEERIRNIIPLRLKTHTESTVVTKKEDKKKSEFEKLRDIGYDFFHNAGKRSLLNPNEESKNKGERQ